MIPTTFSFAHIGSFDDDKEWNLRANSLQQGKHDVPKVDIDEGKPHELPKSQGSLRNAPCEKSSRGSMPLILESV